MKRLCPEYRYFGWDDKFIGRECEFYPWKSYGESIIYFPDNKTIIKGRIDELRENLNYGEEEWERIIQKYKEQVENMRRNPEKYVGEKK